MIPHGAWILAYVLTIGAHDTIIKYVEYYEDPTFGYYDCLSDRDKKSKEDGIPMTCLKEDGA